MQHAAQGRSLAPYPREKRADRSCVGHIRELGDHVGACGADFRDRLQDLLRWRTATDQHKPACTFVCEVAGDAQPQA